MVARVTAGLLTLAVCVADLFAFSCALLLPFRCCPRGREGACNPFESSFAHVDAFLEKLRKNR